MPTALPIPTAAPSAPADPAVLGYLGESSIDVAPLLGQRLVVNLNGPETGVSVFDAFTLQEGTLSAGCTHVLLIAMTDCFTLLGLVDGSVAIYKRGYFEESLVGNILISQNPEFAVIPLTVSTP